MDVSAKFAVKFGLVVSLLESPASSNNNNSRTHTSFQNYLMLSSPTKTSSTLGTSLSSSINMSSTTPNSSNNIFSTTFPLKPICSFNKVQRRNNTKKSNNSAAETEDCHNSNQNHYNKKDGQHRRLEQDCERRNLFAIEPCDRDHAWMF